MTVHVKTVLVVMYVMIVATIIVVVYAWDSIIEMGAYVVVVDSKCPSATVDIGWTEEIGAIQEIIPLPVVEYIAQVLVATVVVHVIHSVYWA